MILFDALYLKITETYSESCHTLKAERLSKIVAAVFYLR